MLTVGYAKDVLATPFFVGVIYACLRLDLNRHRYTAARVFACALGVDFMFSVIPSLHHEPLTGEGHWGLGVTLLAGVGMLCSMAWDRMNPMTTGIDPPAPWESVTYHAQQKE